MKTTRLEMVSLIVLLVLLPWGGVAPAQVLRTTDGEVNKAPRGMGRIVQEIQNRHGGILDGKLSELTRDLLLGDVDIVRYFEDNKSRRGATIYAVACGGAGEKTIRLIYYAAEGMEGIGGETFSKVKGWVFTQIAAQGFADKGMRMLQSSLGNEFTVTSSIGENLVEIIIYPSSSQPVEAPVAGEAANFR